MEVAGVGYRGGRSCAGTMVALLFVGGAMPVRLLLFFVVSFVLERVASVGVQRALRRERSLAQPAAGCFLS